MADVEGPRSSDVAQAAAASSGGSGQVATASQVTEQGASAAGQATSAGEQAAAASDTAATVKLGAVMAVGMGTSMAAGLAASQLSGIASSALLGGAASGVVGSVASTVIGGASSALTGTVASVVGSQVGSAIAGPMGGIMGGTPAAQRIPGVADVAAQSTAALAGSAVPGVAGQAASVVAGSAVSALASPSSRPTEPTRSAEPTVTRSAISTNSPPSQQADEQPGTRSVQKLLFELTSEALPESTCVLSFRGEEGLSRTYVFELNLLIPGDDGLFFDLDGAVGRRATLKFLDEEEDVRSVIHGMLNELELVEAQDEGSLYRAVLVPELWRLGRGQHSRIFVDQKFPDILTQVLDHAGLTSEDYELRLRGSYSKLDHVCQYKESDLAFLGRWMEREGIYYFFEQGEEKEKLIIVDQKTVHAKLQCGPKRYFPQRGRDVSPVEAFRTFRWTRSLQASGVRVADYNYLIPDFPVFQEAKAPGGAQGAVVSIYGENVGREADAKRLAKLRAEGLESQQTIYRGEGRVYGLRPGYRFTVDEHPKLDYRKELLIVGLQHRGNQLELGGGEYGDLAMTHGGPTDYCIEVTAIPVEVQYRPVCSTPIPRIDGLESAVVDGPVEDEYAQIDEYGRYYVKIHFDESDLKDGRASTRVRMLQPHGGSQEGFHFPLRKGTEVMLSFMGGHPDRPVIVGVGPNTYTPSPVTQQNATQNVIQTGGLNRLTMEDIKGRQHIDLECPVERSSLHLGAHEGARKHNLILTTDGNGLIHTGGDRNITVDGNQTEEVQKDLTETYHGNRTTHVFKKLDEKVDDHVAQTFNAGMTQKVTAGGVVREVTGGETETITGGRELTINGGSKETINGKLDQTVLGGVGITTPGRYEITAAGEIVLTSGQRVRIVVPETIEASLAKHVKMTAYSVDFIGAKLGIHGVKTDASALKIDLAKFVIKNNPVEIGKKGSKVSNNGMTINVNVSVDIRMSALLIVM